jgi:phospholipase D1/2
MEGLIDSVSQSPYCKINRYTSFCPISSNNNTKAYINANQYYEDVANDMERAKHEIYITDWWMSPEVYLRRPIPATNGVPTCIRFRLDQILKRAADRGCKIFILLYREFEQALPNKSQYTQQTLMSLHTNIEVIRHPGNLIFLWSHHEKTVIIDQSVVYMGGLDLCYGRFDLPDYPLCEPLEDSTKIYFPGQDYSNVRIKDFVDVDMYYTTLIDKFNTPRMPWRDIAIRLKGPVTKDVTRHFIQYWNFAKSDLEGSNRRNFLYKKNFEEESDQKKKPARTKYQAKRYDIDSIQQADNEELNEFIREQRSEAEGYQDQMMNEHTEIIRFELK